MVGASNYSDFGRRRTESASATSRRTRIGSFLHYTRVDELPQLVNLLRGDLTIVGDETNRTDWRRVGT